MTAKLKKALERISKLPAKVQNSIADNLADIAVELEYNPKAKIRLLIMNPRNKHPFEILGEEAIKEYEQKKTVPLEKLLRSVR